MEWAYTTNRHSKTDDREHDMCGGHGTVTVVQPTSRRSRSAAGASGRSPLATVGCSAWLGVHVMDLPTLLQGQEPTPGVR